MECASDILMLSRTSNFYRLNSLVQISVCIITVIVSIPAFHSLYTKNTFHRSTQQLLLMSILYSDFHAIIYGYVQGWSLYRSIVYSKDPCHIMFIGEECYVLTWITGVAKMLMIFIQSALTFDRSFDSIISMMFPNIKPAKYHGLYSNLTVIALSIAATGFMYSAGPTRNLVHTCLQQGELPLNRVIEFLIVYFIVALLCLILNIVTIQIIKRPQPNVFILKARYSRMEIRNSSFAICVISIIQFIVMALYVTGSYTLFYMKPIISKEYFSNLLLLFYTIPYATFALPFSIIYCIKWISMKRKTKICLMTQNNKKENISGHFIKLTNYWDDVFATKTDKKQVNQKY